MTTDQTIAACIAAHTPIGSAYRLLPIPGTELCDECPCCGAEHHIQQCGEIRAALHQPELAAPYTLARSSSGYEAIWANGLELNNAATVAHLNGQAAAIAEVLAELTAARGELAQAFEAGRTSSLADYIALDQVNTDLRIALDQAHQHIGALCSAIEHETTAYNAYMHCLDDEESARRADEHLKTSIAQSATLTAARAFLRRA